MADAKTCEVRAPLTNRSGLTAVTTVINNSIVTVKVKVKQSRYRPGVAQRVQS